MPMRPILFLNRPAKGVMYITRSRVHCSNAVSQTSISVLYKGDAFALPTLSLSSGWPLPVMRTPFIHIRVLVLFLAVLHSTSKVYAVLVNRTIDDTNGDSVTGFPPSYIPSEDFWNRQSGCSRCWSHLDTSSVFDGTWHSSTFDATHTTAKAVNISFTGNSSSLNAALLHSVLIRTVLSWLEHAGSAFYAYFALANIPRSGFTSSTNLSITLDGSYAAQFVHIPDISSSTEQWLYRVLVYASAVLSDEAHWVLIGSGLDGDAGDQGSLLLFDYAIYTCAPLFS